MGTVVGSLQQEWDRSELGTFQCMQHRVRQPLIMHPLHYLGTIDTSCLVQRGHAPFVCKIQEREQDELWTMGRHDVGAGLTPIKVVWR